MADLLAPEIAEQLRSLPLTYPEVGATANVVLPFGYHHQWLRIRIGCGAQQFEAAADALLSWEMHQRAGLVPVVSDLRAEPGAVAVLRLRLGPLNLRVPVRVITVIDEPRRRGFVYGTLPGHIERGEESFVIEQSADGTVTFIIAGFSRPGRWYSWIGAPVARAGQLLVTERYVDAMHAVAQSAFGE